MSGKSKDDTVKQNTHKPKIWDQPSFLQVEVQTVAQYMMLMLSMSVDNECCYEFEVLERIFLL